MAIHRSTYAVLTGDIVNSTAIAPESLQLLFHEMKGAVESFGKSHPESVIGRLVVIQGDRWQVLLRHHQVAERLMTFIAAIARKNGYLTRISLGIGSVNRIDSINISESTGEAFTLSGHALNELELSIYKKQYWHIEGADVSSHKKILIALLGDLASAWTRLQAEAILLTLNGYKPEQGAEKLDILRPAFVKRLAAARWRYFEMTSEESESGG